ncbi:MAG: TlpA family protein disulfide reductase [Flavobacteriaceae bacterium]
MKKLSLVILTMITIVSCTKELPKNYLTFSGKLENNKDSILTIKSRSGIIKMIKINSDGTFKDTLKVKKPQVFFIETNPTKGGPIYLNNGYDLVLNGDLENFQENLTYSGKGADSNNFIISQINFSKQVMGDNPMELFTLEKTEFTKRVNKLKTGMDSVLNLYKDIDSTLYSNAKKQNDQMINFATNNYDRQHPIALAQKEAKKKTTKGKISPKFINYQNFKGGKTSLDDLKGKYVYIDMWATWCGPCIAEIPALKKLETDYHGKKIQFVSISIDNERTAGTWEKAEEKWRKMVADKNLSGVQLYAGKDVNFVTAYQVNTIPRFLLIDPKGNIVDANAPRPSSQEIRNLFKELGI